MPEETLTMGEQIAAEFARIEADRNTLRNKGVALKLVESSANLDAIAEAFDGIADNGSITVTVKEGETYSIPAGYHDGSGTVSGVAGGGNYTLQSKSVTPTKAQQTVTPDEGSYGLSDVTVAAIPENYQDVTSVTAAAGDVLAGKTVVDATGAIVAGTMQNNGAVAATLDAETTEYAVPAGYHSGLGKVSVALEQKSATPTKAAQTVEPTAGKLLSSVTVAAIPAEYVTTDDATAAAADVLAGKTAYMGGAKVTGTMQNNGAVSGTFDGLTATSFEVPAGYTSGGTVSLDDTILNRLKAI